MMRSLRNYLLQKIRHHTDVLHRLRSSLSLVWSARVGGIGVDSTPFTVEHDPGNPAADANGDVKRPNVNLIVEMGDLREANRAYEADLQVMKQSRELLSMTIDLLKGA